MKAADAEPIASGDDLSEAKAQSEAMAMAKESLPAALDMALKGETGFRSGSIIPAFKGGHPVAEVTLVMGNQWKTVPEKFRSIAGVFGRHCRLRTVETSCRANHQQPGRGNCGHVRAVWPTPVSRSGRQATCR